MHIAWCTYFQKESLNFSQYGIILPSNVSKIDEYFCAPMHRKGLVCSECIDGYGLSMTSYQSMCVECKNNWQGILLYLLVELSHITILYILILVFRIDIISAPMTCFIMYSVLVQFILTTTPHNHSANKILFTEQKIPRIGTKILITLSSIWNLDFMHHIIPPFCISSQLKPFHLECLNWISIFYPLCLMLLTYTCVELHDRNFRPLVWLSNIIHMTCYRLRKAWNTKNDMINVFSSFLLLCYGKVIIQIIRISECHNCLYEISESGVHNIVCPTSLDPNIDCLSAKHLAFIIPAILAFIIFNLLPTCLLVFYPIKAVRALLSKCRLDTIALKIFVEKFHHFYKNGLDGGRDLRSFCGLYFILPCVIATSKPLSEHLVESTYYFSKAIIFWTSALIVAFVKPYKSQYMNVLDSLLLAHLGLLCILLPTSVSSKPGYHPKDIYIVFPQVMLFLPFAGFSIYVTTRVVIMIYKISYTYFYERIKAWRLNMNCDRVGVSEEQSIISGHGGAARDYGTQTINAFA